jgi:hypothetical protein
MAYFEQFVEHAMAEDTSSFQDPLLAMDLPSLDTRSDLGVAEFATASDVNLHCMLRLSKQGEVPFWNAYVTNSRASPWDSLVLFDFHSCNGDPSANFYPCCLHWAQLSSLVTVIKIATADPKPSTHWGILLADEVGLGKTGSIMGLVAFFLHVREHIENNAPLPHNILGKFTPHSVSTHASQTHTRSQLHRL